MLEITYIIIIYLVVDVILWSEQFDYAFILKSKPIQLLVWSESTSYTAGTSFVEHRLSVITDV